MIRTFTDCPQSLDFETYSWIQLHLAKCVEVKDQTDPIFEWSVDGLDISGDNQGNIDLEKVPQSGFQACFVKERRFVSVSYVMIFQHKVKKGFDLNSARKSIVETIYDYEKKRSHNKSQLDNRNYFFWSQ